jgi:hypothetical protein
MDRGIRSWSYSSKHGFFQKFVGWQTQPIIKPVEFCSAVSVLFHTLSPTSNKPSHFHWISLLQSTMSSPVPSRSFFSALAGVSGVRFRFRGTEEGPSKLTPSTGQDKTTPD